MFLFIFVFIQMMLVYHENFGFAIFVNRKRPNILLVNFLMMKK